MYLCTLQLQLLHVPVDMSYEPTCIISKSYGRVITEEAQCVGIFMDVLQWEEAQFVYLLTCSNGKKYIYFYWYAKKEQSTFCFSM